MTLVEHMKQLVSEMESGSRPSSRGSYHEYEVALLGRGTTAEWLIAVSVPIDKSRWLPSMEAGSLEAKERGDCARKAALDWNGAKARAGVRRRGCGLSHGLDGVHRYDTVHSSLASSAPVPQMRPTVEEGRI